MNDDIALLFAYVLNETATPPVPGDPEEVGLVTAMKPSVVFQRHRAEVRGRIVAQLRTRADLAVAAERGLDPDVREVIQEVLRLHPNPST